jgi:hypothetical protein
MFYNIALRDARTNKIRYATGRIIRSGLSYLGRIEGVS